MCSAGADSHKAVSASHKILSGIVQTCELLEPSHALQSNWKKPLTESGKDGMGWRVGRIGATEGSIRVGGSGGSGQIPAAFLDLIPLHGFTQTCTSYFASAGLSITLLHCRGLLPGQEIILPLPRGDLNNYPLPHRMHQ